MGTLPSPIGRHIGSLNGLQSYIVFGVSSGIAHGDNKQDCFVVAVSIVS